MRKSIKLIMIPAALALASAAGIAATTAPANAQVRFDLHLGTPGYYYRPYYNPYYRPYYAPYGYRSNCYWDAYYGRVCY